MSDDPLGRVLTGERDAALRSYEVFDAQPVDLRRVTTEVRESDRFQTTLAGTTSATGPGTFLGSEHRTLTFEPTERCGWWFERTDLRDDLPIHVSAYNVWTTARNIVLRAGSPHNYVRMVEHIIALKGLGLDNVMIRLDSGDPPLFDSGSMDLVNAVEEAGLTSSDVPARILTVKEPVTVAGPNGSFLTFLPRADGLPLLDIDCAVDFATAIGAQRIQFTFNRETCRHGAFARTNTTAGMYVVCKTIGKVFADIRHLGYTRRNILVAGRGRYWNEPRMVKAGKSLEAVWHRAVMDLCAAVALIDGGRFAGRILSYKAGHSLDAHMIRQLYRHELLVALTT